MQGHGHDESAPTPGGMNVGRLGVFVGCFGSVRCVVGRPLATLWQNTSCCRGRFIVPAYM